MTGLMDTIREQIGKLNENQLMELRQQINDRLLTFAEGQVGSADASADDEKRKLIAQHGNNANEQLSAQSVPEPVSDEVKDLQNEAALAEHQAKGQRDIGDQVTAKERKKLGG